MSYSKRYAWQERCLDAWAVNHYRGTVQAVTGAGKTMLALKAIQRLEQETGCSVLVRVVVPTKSLMSQWENAIKKEKLITEFEGDMSNCITKVGCRGGGRKDSPERKYVIYVINSARYQLAHSILGDLKKGRSVFLIADECHHYFSGENRRIFDFVPLLSKQPGNYYSLGLSATLKEKDAASVLEDTLGKKIFDYSIEQALRCGTVCDFVIYQIALSFLPEELAEYEKLSDELMAIRSRLCTAYPLLKEKGIPFFGIVKSLSEGKNVKLARLARTFLNLAYQRKRITCMAQNRISCTCQLLEKIGSEKQCIIFGESIEQTEQLYHRISRHYGNKVGRYHSKMGQQANRNALERFRNGELRILISCRALDEGVDVPDAAVGIILSGTSVERQRIQRLGRLIRKGEEEKCAELYYLFVKESKEEKSYFPLRGETFKTVDLEFISSVDITECNDARVKRSKSRSCLHDKAFELGTH